MSRRPEGLPDADQPSGRDDTQHTSLWLPPGLRSIENRENIGIILTTYPLYVPYPITFTLRFVAHFFGLFRPTSALVLGSMPAIASTATTTFAVSATVVATCGVTATARPFGNYTGGLINATSTASVTCINTTTYNLGLSAGLATGATVSARSMTGGAVPLNYALSRPFGKTPKSLGKMHLPDDLAAELRQGSRSAIRCRQKNLARCLHVSERGRRIHGHGQLSHQVLKPLADLWVSRS
jgi:hypothetical protein